MLGKGKAKKGMVDRRAHNWRASSERSLGSKSSWLQRTRSDRSIDAEPKAPYRLLSPLGKKVLLRNSLRLEHENCDALQAAIQMLPDPSIDEQKGSADAMDEKLLSGAASSDTSQILRSSKFGRVRSQASILGKGLRETKDEKLLSGTASSDASQTLKSSKFRKVRSAELLMLGKGKAKKGMVDRRAHNWRASSERSLGSKSSWLQRTRSDRSIDAEPKAPYRLLSPLGKKVLLRNTLGLEELENCDVLQNAIQLLPDPRIDEESPVETTGSSSPATTITAPAGDVASAILARIPTHIKEQLSLEEWHRILDPTKSRERKASTTGCQMPSVTRQSDKAYDALYCTEHESKTQEIGESRRPRVEESKIEQESVASMEKNQSSVSFGTVSVRWYERILVAHPCTSSGPSLGIGWNYTETSESIDWSQRGGDDLRLGRDLRERMVKELGYTTRDIAYAVREGLRIKNQRRRTINDLKLNVVDVEKVECIAEKCNRKLRKLQSQFLVSVAV